jgi:aminoglycoside phosphotransferase (APT) family kinase protein
VTASSFWAADIHIDVTLAQQLIASQFPTLPRRPLRPFGNGWDNTAFLIDDEFVFRFPRRRIAAPLLEREIALLPHLSSRLPLAVPVPCFVGAPTAGYPWPFAGYRLIPGATADSLPLSDDARRELAIPLAAFLRALHAIDPVPLVACGLPLDELGRLDHEKRLRLTRERSREHEADGEFARWQPLLTWLEEHPPARAAADQHCVLHGDLYARHVVLNSEAQAVGVIDWGDIHFGDPALDIAVAFLLLPPHAHAAFRTAYGLIDERTWSAARYRAIYHAVLEYDYGVRSGDRKMHEMGRLALDFLKGETLG